ncbi:Hypothetical predicted protein [Pelobates cultripes]|uniref:Uncharacterized protein n=1 Tax=Pelobates cultripes TaxID=61616 RepID=A0AAD1S1K9_PELCU|nr:Hypothetical predicted protein [Pelobates cultripes]
MTEDTLRSLLDKLCRNITADIVQFQKEIKGVSARLHNTELDTAARETRIAALEQQLSTIQRSHKQNQDHIADLEDKRRWKNIIILFPETAHHAVPS